MKIRVGAATDTGRVREHNEDSYLAAAPLFAVADGMGGHQGGEVASRLALETIDELRARDDVALPQAVREANRAVLDQAARDRGLTGMGTTLTALVLKGDGIDLAHVGDSRAYLLRDGELQQLTEDHTLVHRMVMEGKLTEEEAKIHPHRSILTRALGVESDVEVDGATVQVLPGDRVLLCSDGLTSMVTDERIHEVLATEDDPQEASAVLVRAANEAGGQDNVTVMILDFEAGEGVEGTALGLAPGDGPPPGRPAPRRRRRRLVLWLLVAIAVLAAALVGGRLYLDRQWFVGVHEERVALYRGIPTEVVGIELFRLVEETDLPADEAAELAPWVELRDGITAGSESEAREIVRQIAADLREQERSVTG